jgi:hypothetical protein
VLVSGGIVWDGQPEADLMKDALAEYGITVRWVEARFARHRRQRA